MSDFWLSISLLEDTKNNLDFCFDGNVGMGGGGGGGGGAANFVVTFGKVIIPPDESYIHAGYMVYTWYTW